MKIKEYFSDDIREKLIERIDEFLDSEGGFLIISNKNPGEEPHNTDMYKGICRSHVLKITELATKHATEHGLLEDK